MGAGIFVVIVIILNLILGTRAFILASELKREIHVKASSLTVLYAIQNEILFSAKNSLLPFNSEKAFQCYQRAKVSLRIMYAATIVVILFNMPDQLSD